VNEKFSLSLWEQWNPEIKESCEKSETLCMAIFSVEGELLSVNAAMKGLFKDTARESLINPEFNTLIKILPDSSPVFDGLMTIGNRNSSGNMSIKAKVFRRGDQLLIIGEVDVHQLVFVNRQLFELNSEVNDLQRKLIKEKVELKRTLEQLKESQNKAVQSELKIREMLSEKELLLKEVHHRIKNNMNTVKSLLFLQRDKLEDPIASAVLKDAEGRVESMMLLYDKLYRSDNFGEVSINAYLKVLLREVINNFSNRDVVELVEHVDDFMLETKTIFPLGIIINEIITNIMKYAFIGRANGVITVSASREDNRVRMLFEDDGVGISETVDLENSTGFGMQLVSMLTKQIGGSIRIERGEGTRFVLEFDL